MYCEIGDGGKIKSNKKKKVEKKDQNEEEDNMEIKEGYALLDSGKMVPEQFVKQNYLKEKDEAGVFNVF